MGRIDEEQSAGLGVWAGGWLPGPGTDERSVEAEVPGERWVGPEEFDGRPATSRLNTLPGPEQGCDSFDRFPRDSTGGRGRRGRGLARERSCHRCQADNDRAKRNQGGQGELAD